MAIRVADGVLNDGVSAVVANANGGSVEFYTGNRPTNLGDAPGETLLATVDLQATAFGAPAAGVAAAAGVPIATVGAVDGEIGWARVLASGGTAVWDEDSVSTSTGAAITVNTLSVAAGVAFELLSYEFYVAV